MKPFEEEPLERERAQERIAELRASLDEVNLVPGETGEDLTKVTLRNYAWAAAGLHHMHSESGKGAPGFVSSLLEMVGAVVKGASIARADESVAA